MMKTQRILLISLAAGVVIGGLLALLFPVGTFWLGWLSGALLVVCAVFLLLSVQKWLETGAQSTRLTLAAFAIRLVIGVGFMLVLPAWGYDTDPQNAGYVFKDAYTRDTASWKLADAGESLFQVFEEEFFTDQYGGLAFLSALVYRTLSPDGHRPYLILILSSWAFAQGIPFLYAAIGRRFTPKLALIASWVLVLYPEGIFFTASQMREPFIIGGMMLLLWGMLQWQEKTRRKSILLICVPTIAVMALISWLMLGAVLLLLGVWFGLEWIEAHVPEKKRTMAYLGLFFAALVLLGGGVVIGGEWLRYTIWWDMREMLLSSGHIELMVENLPEPLQYAVITVYGVLQMVPPAALIESAAPLWRVISTFRAVGWYLVLPVLAFGLYVIWKKENRKERVVIGWLLLFSWAWIFFSALRGGGDSWDNPRYRMLVLPLIALLMVWIWERRDDWLWRLAAVEGFALLLFTHWYLARYLHWFTALPMKVMLLMIAGFSLLVIAAGIFRAVKPRQTG